MWRVRVGAQTLAAKQFGPGRGFEQALLARQRLEGLGVAPTLVWADRRERLIVSPWLGDALPSAPAGWFEVGRLLGRLHGVEPPADSVPLGRAYRRRLESTAARAGSETDGIAGAIGALDLATRFASLQAWLDAQPRVTCHRDVAPRNLRRVDGAARLLDFEHAAGDVWLADLVKLAASPEGLDAVLPVVLDGYRGRGLDADEHEVLAALVALFAVSTWAWGARHRDTALARYGERLTSSLRQDMS